MATVVMIDREKHLTVGFCEKCIMYEDEWGVYGIFGNPCGHETKIYKPSEIATVRLRLEGTGCRVREKILKPCSIAGCFSHRHRRKLCRRHFKHKHRILGLFTRSYSYWSEGKVNQNGTFVP